MFFWGMSFIWFKIVNQYYHPITIIFIRLVISSIILFTSYKIINKPDKIDRADYKYFFIAFLCQPFFYFLGESFGLSMVSSTIASIIISSIPVFAPIVGFIFLRERISLLNILGIFISFVGIAVMILKKDMSFSAEPIGILLLFFAIMSALVYSVFIKKLTDKYSSLTIITYQNFVGALMFLPLFLIFDFNHFKSVQINFELIYTILLLAIFASSFSYIMYISVIREIGIIKANVYTNLIPIFTVVFSYFILSEEITIAKILGMIIVLAGLLLSQKNNKVYLKD